MQLFTTYGVQSSVPAKTVVAVIEAGSGSTYSFTFSDGTYYGFTTGAITSDGNLHRTNIVDIIGDTIILDNRIKVGRISFWNGETFLGFYSHIGTTFVERLGEIPANGVITPPANATRFAFDGHKNNSMYVYTQTYSTFISLVATSPAVPQTVTFFDEYPNGTQIGDVVAVSGLDYDITWISAYRDGPSGNYFANNDNKTFVEIPIINNTIIISTVTSAFIGFWNNSTYLGWYNVGNYAPGNGNRTDYSSLSGEIPIINNATHFSISVGNSTQTTLTVSSGTSSIVNPPATYKIRQLVFEG